MKLLRYIFFCVICASSGAFGEKLESSASSESPEALLQVVKKKIEQGWTKRHYRVGVSEQPPFSFLNKNTKKWEGIAIDIWQGIAAANKLTYEFHVVPSLNQGQRDVEAGRFDLLIGAFPAVPQNDYHIEYSLPFYVSGLGVAFAPQRGKIVMNFFRMFLSWEFLSALFGLVLFVFTGAVGMWIIERRNNPLFGKEGFLKAVGNGMYWSAGTVTSVGSGNTLPDTPRGKAFSIFWMFIGVLLTSVLMAAITSSLTVGQLSSLFTNPKNLKSMTIGCIEGSDGEFYLSENLIACRPQQSLEEGIKALLNNDIEALIYSDPLLRYEISTKNVPVEVYSTTYSQLYYSFVIGDQAFLHEVNKAILLYINGPQWSKDIFKYLKISKDSVVKKFEGFL